MFKARLFAIASMAALLTACGGGSSVVPSSTEPAAPQDAGRAELSVTGPFTAVGDAGVTVRLFPTVGDPVYTGRQLLATSPLLYHNGPVQTSPKIYVVFWGSAWNGSGDPNGVATRLKNFYTAMAGGRWMNSTTQYTQSGGAHVGNPAGQFIGSYVDTTSSPPSRPTQSQLAAEASKAAARYGDYSASASYIVALPHGISPSGFKTQYCAWHSSTNAAGGVIAYTNLPYMPDAGASCGANSVNSSGILDGVTIVGGHEQGETATDPQPNSGWLDSAGSENGDKCAWTALQNNPNAGGYPTQPLWSNANNGCVQAY